MLPFSILSSQSARSQTKEEDIQITAHVRKFVRKTEVSINYSFLTLAEFNCWLNVDVRLTPKQDGRIVVLIRSSILK